MKTVPQEAFERGKEFVQREARPLDQRLFEHSFENGNREVVIDALTSYQNEDGGFGRAIELDFRLPSSSPMATTLGLGLLRELSVPSSHPMVQKAIRYLLSTYEPTREGWQSIPRQVNDFPHAPWWHFDEKTGKNGAETRGNPSAEIIGNLHTWPNLVPAGFLDEVTASMLNYLESLPDPIEMHELRVLANLERLFTHDP